MDKGIKGQMGSTDPETSWQTEKKWMSLSFAEKEVQQQTLN